MTVISDALNNDNDTPLRDACYWGKLDVVQYLVEEAHCDISECIIRIPMHVLTNDCYFRCTSEQVQQYSTPHCMLSWSPRCGAVLGGGGPL